MKHNPIILMTLLLGLTLFGCKKQEQETLTPKIKNDKVETTATTATFTWTVDWPGKLISVVELSENEDMSNSQYYGSEAETDNHDFTVTASDLKVSTKYYYRHVVWNHFYSDNKFVMEGKSFTTKTDVPKVKTVEVTDVTRTTATVIGEVTDECGSEVTERGVCWGTSHNPTTSGSHLNSGTGTGNYSIAIPNLEVGKTYYVRAYAKNSNGTAYGEELDFVTGDAVKPTVTTAEVTNIDWRTATGGGEVTDDGDATVTERGVCWSTSHNPEVSGSHANNGTGTGSYTVDMTGLTAGATYYVRAYAKNIAGLSYGNEVSFAAKAPELPVVTTSNPSEVTRTTAVCGGEVINDGGADVVERGVCWSTNSTPTISGSHLAETGNDIGSFSIQITGLSSNTSYYVCSYAINSIGISYGTPKSFATSPIGRPTVTTAQVTNITQTSATGGGNVIDDGGADVTERGICWSTEHNPALENCLGNSHSGTETGGFSSNLAGLTHGTKYYVCAYATNIEGTSYGNEVSFITLANPPIVITGEITNIGMTSATASGTIIDNGGAEVTEKGVCWSISHNPTINDDYAPATTGTGTFNVNVLGLIKGTDYYLKAYAKNSGGINYGDEVHFTTELTWPNGMLPGLFTINEQGDKVCFSQGNLQYIGSATNPYWKFADNQWYSLSNNGQGSISQNVDRDLFGWGTSGWNSGATCYQPWSTSQTNRDYYPGGSYTNNLIGNYANADWGVYNEIYNGGNTVGQWRTLTKDEWDYVLQCRNDAYMKHGYGSVSGVRYGMILLPDSWTMPPNLSFTPGNSSMNNYTGLQWEQMEANGAVFLPCAGGRDGSSVFWGGFGRYWSSSFCNNDRAYSVDFRSGGLDPSYENNRYFGISVRLVAPAEN